MIKLTPGMQQYMEIKKQHPDCIVLFRMGDFYETFYEDAKTAARELEITLTARGKGESRAPLAGIPYHAIDSYLPKLVNKGYKVAICEQLEDPKKAKGIVKRGVVRIVSPGTIVENNMLDSKSNNYIMSLFVKLNKFGVALIDLSTGEFLVSELSENKLVNEITRFKPSEVIIPESLKVNQELVKQINSFVNEYSDHYFSQNNALEMLKKHFNVLGVEGFGIKNDSLIVNAAGALLSYLNETQKTNLSYINRIRKYSVKDYMVIDSSTLRNLEIIENVFDNKGTLLGVLDKTVTSMGARMLKKFVLQPLLKKEQIEKRLDCVDELTRSPMLREELRSLLKQFADIERLISRINFGNGNARDLIGLKNSLKLIPLIKKELSKAGSELLKEIDEMSELNDVKDLVESAIKNEPNLSVREGNMIKKGYNKELDELREMCFDNKSWIAKLELQEKERTGIGSLKVGFNKVFGYYITVSKANLHLVPQNYIRKQTLVNAERFITPELKEKEALILNAEEKINELEYELFVVICKRIAEKTSVIQDVANKIALLDVMICFAVVASGNNYVRPELNNDGKIELVESRHPVLEQVEEVYVPNDCKMDKDGFKIITGPNMAGKSVYMKQVALIQLMAQIGCFVPCQKASVGLVDRIFTRVGAYDDLVHGQSTFMVEMNETANILNNATENSLVILDEIGRGTSTFDGISIAWSVAEYIHKNIKAKTLFATHYHQLNKLAEKFPSVRNYNISVKEKEDEIVFLRKIIEGGTDKSYGIQVAKLAGLPEEVIERSKVIMNRLEMEDEIAERIHATFKDKSKKEREEMIEKEVKSRQLSLFDV